MKNFSATALISFSILAGQALAGSQHTGFVVSQLNLPTNVAELTARSTLIVTATVVAISPARVVRRQVTPILGPSGFSEDLETDAIVRINRVLKGQASASQIVVHQLGGILPGRSQLSSQFYLMNPGQQFILYLVPLDSVERSRIPEHPAGPRYSILDAFAGMVRVDGEKLKISPGMPPSFRERYDGKMASEMLQEIENGAR